MAERLKDKEDLKLEALFRSGPIRDDGFSARVESRIRRQTWIRRLTLPIAFVVGAVIAAKPLMQLAGLIPTVVDIVPQSILNSFDLPLSGFLQGPTVILGILLLGATLMIGQMLED